MIGQYLSNKNESATVAKSEIFPELNKAQLCLGTGGVSALTVQFSGQLVNYCT